MQKGIQSKRYIFQADAFGVAGQIVHPFHDIIPVQAASALPSEGGFGSARAEAFRYKEILSFGAAYTQVIGTEAHEGFSETLSLSVVEKFNLLDVVTCDRMVARLTSNYPGERQEGSDLPAENYIVPIGSHFEGLRIGNVYFERLEVAPEYFCRPEHASWTGLQKALASDQERNMLQPLSLRGQDGNPVPLRAGGQGANVLGFCLALTESKSAGEPGVPLRFKLPQFGTVHLGEFFCYPTARQLTMLRVDLGCPVQGSVSASGGIVRGQPYSS